MSIKLKKPKLNFFFYNNYRFRWIPYYYKNGLMWKDKFDCPRLEYPPTIRFEWLWFGFLINKGCDQYWEQWLWINYWHNGDYNQAKESWPWTDYDTKLSTWDDKLMIK